MTKGLYRGRPPYRALADTTSSYLLIPQEPAADLPPETMTFIDVAEHLKLPCAVMDDDLKILCANPSFMDVFDMPAAKGQDELQLTQRVRRINGDTMADWWQETRSFANGGMEGLFTVMSRTGSERYLRMSFRRYSGKYWLVYGIDVSADEHQRRQTRSRLTLHSTLVDLLNDLVRAESPEQVVNAVHRSMGQQWRATSTALILPADDTRYRMFWQAGNDAGSESLAGEQVIQQGPTPSACVKRLDEIFAAIHLPKFAGREQDPVLVVPLDLMEHGFAALFLAVDDPAAILDHHEEVLHTLGLQVSAAIGRLHASRSGVQPGEHRASAANALNMLRRIQEIPDTADGPPLLCECLRQAAGATGLLVRRYTPEAYLEAEIAHSGRMPQRVAIRPEAIARLIGEAKSGTWPLSTDPADGTIEVLSPHDRTSKTLQVSGFLVKAESGRLYVFLFSGCQRSATDDSALELLVSAAAARLDAWFLKQQWHSAAHLLNGVLNQSRLAVVTTDRSGRIDSFSRGAEKVLGYRAEEVLGKPVQQLIRGQKKFVRRILQTLQRREELVNFECEVLHKHGQAIPFNLAISPIAHDSESAMYLIIGQDISEKRRAEEELQQRSEELEDLVYLITHNLKTPIVSVEGFASLLMEEAGPALSPEAQRYLERIRKNVEFMNVMISDLLEFSRFGKMEQTFEPIRLQELINAVIEDLKVHHPAAKLRFEIPRPLPIVHGHREGIKTVFENLLSNAAKYRKPQGTAHIRITYEEKPRFFAFHVEDNGIGIEEEFRKKVFNLFQRGSNVGEVEGTGVGLAICKRIVHKHGGLITVHSAPGKGTRVSFTLPKLKPTGP